MARILTISGTWACPGCGIAVAMARGMVRERNADSLHDGLDGGREDHYPPVAKTSRTEQLVAPPGRAPASDATSELPPASERGPRVANPYDCLGVDLSGGVGLPANLGASLGDAYGIDTSGIRVHTDAPVADRAGAEALTYGSDIFFGSGHYNPGDAHGAFVVAHEVAHVAQHGSGGADEARAHLADPAAQSAIEVGSDSDPAEAEASQAAHAALAGQRFTLSPAPARLRAFKQGNGEATQGGHAFHTESALRHMGLSDAKPAGGIGVSEVRAARQGNWQRDLSQAIFPATRGLLDPILTILNIISIKDFGRGFKLEELGGYDAVEHVDNPAGLRASGSFAQGAMPQVGDMDQDHHQAEAALNDPKSGYVAAGAAPASKDQDKTAYADVDPRYAQTAIGKKVMNPGDAAAYHVDESGIPRYMHTSRDFLKTQLKNSMRLGRRGNEGRGPKLFASSTHTLQDYYAHSNFAEVALNVLLRERGKGGKRTGLRVAGADGKVQTISADTYHSVLDTHAHAHRVDARGKTTPSSANLEFQGREVVTTGTSNLADTIPAVLEEVQDKWKQMNPFQRGKREPSAMIGAVLDYIEMDPESPSQFNQMGARISGMIHRAVPVIERLAPIAATVVEGAGGVAGAGVRGAGRVASGGLGVLNRVNGLLGGDDDYFDDARDSVRSSTRSAAGAVEGAASSVGDAIRGVSAQLSDFAMTLDGQQHLLRRAYNWIYENVNPIEAIASLAERIPHFGPQIAQMIRTISDELRKAVEEVFGRLWNKIIDKGVKLISGVIEQFRVRGGMKARREAGADDPRRSSMSIGIERLLGGVGDLYENGMPVNGIGPRNYTPPTHTEVAKDHNDLTQGARDGDADHAHDPMSKQEEGDHEHGEAHAGDDDHHGHVHLGGWLSPIAEGMSMAATRAVGDLVARGWDQLEAIGGNPAPSYPNTHHPSFAAHDAAIDAEVDRWFSHPLDCRSTWESFVRARVADPRVGAELMRRLAASKPAAPDISKARSAAQAVGGDDVYAARPDIYGVESRTDAANHTEPHGRAHP